MRTLGVWMVALGIVLLVACVFPVAAAKTPEGVVGWLVCAGLVPGSMIAVGVRLVRRAEDGVAVPVPDEPEGEAESEEVPDAVLARVGAFDLTRLNAAGWLLLLATFGFVGVEVVAIVWLADRPGWGRWVGQVAPWPAVFLAVGFFAGVRWLLGRLGVSIYRRPPAGGEAGEEADRDGGPALPGS